MAADPHRFAPRSLIIRYSLPLICATVATLLRVLFDPSLSWKAPFVLFFAAILISARFGGIGPGLAATALSLLAGGSLLRRHTAGVPFSLSADVSNLIFFGLVGVVVSVLCGQLRDSLARSRSEEQRLRLISDSVPQFIWTATADSYCDFINARYYEFTGASPDVPPGETWESFLHPDDRQIALDFWTRLITTGNDGSAEFRLRRHDGVYRWFETRAVARRDEHGKVLKWFGYNNEIEEMRELREASRAEAERFARIVATVPGVIVKIVQKPDGTMAVPFASPSILDLYGIAASDLAENGFALFERMNPDDRKRVMNGLAQSGRNLSTWHDEFRVRNPAKGERWINFHASAVHGTDGSAIWYGFLWDTTERKRARELVAQRTEQELVLLKTLVERAPMGIVMLDRRMRHVQASRRFLSDIRLSAEAILGRNHYECFPGLPEKWKEYHRRGFEGETLSRRDESFMAPDGEERWVNWQITPWGDAGETSGGIIIYSEDVTERKRAEILANRRDLEYRALFDNMSEGIAYCRMIYKDGLAMDFTFVSVNPAFSSVIGKTDVVGKKMSEVFGGFPDTRPSAFELFATVCETGQPNKLEMLDLVTNDWLSISAYSPEKGHFVAIIDVITKRKREELAARQWQRAFEQSELGIALANAATDTIDAVNHAYSKLVGYAPEELAGKPFAMLYPQEEMAKRLEALRCGDSAGGHALFESRHVRKDGSEFPVLMDITAVTDEEGIVISRVKMVHDLTRQKQYEAILMESEQTVRALLDSAAHAIFAISWEGNILIANRMAGEMFGYVSENLVGRSMEMLFPEEFGILRKVQEKGYFEQAGANRPGDQLELEGIRENGVRFPVEIGLSSVQTQRGPMAIAFVNDVTERKLAERQIQQLNATLERRVRERTSQLEAANGELESFAYSVSHDLRAPLRGIDGWSMALLEDYGSNLDERGRKYLDRVRAETQRMGFLIDDLLQLSRVTRSSMQQTSVDLSALARQVAADLSERNSARSIHFSIQPGLRARGDARLLEIALENLLGNAVKFTGPRLDAQIEFCASPRRGRSGYAVRDNGVGFEARHAATLFGPFQRLHKASEFPGTGIGLATVKRVVHRHGGEVWAEGEVDHGATFGFTLGGENG